MQRKYSAESRQKGFTLQELRQIVADADSLGMSEDVTFAKGEVTIPGRLKALELIEEEAHNA